MNKSELEQITKEAIEKSGKTLNEVLTEVKAKFKTEIFDKIKNVSNNFLDNIKGSIVDLGDSFAFQLEPCVAGVSNDFFYISKSEIKYIKNKRNRRYI